jgi:formate dehydrogenase iron-sulfur subunit
MPVMYVLHHNDKPQIYADLPVDPKISAVVQTWKGATKYAGLAVMGLAAAGTILHGLFGKANRVSKHEEEEAKELVDETVDHAHKREEDA